MLGKWRIESIRHQKTVCWVTTSKWGFQVRLTFDNAMSKDGYNGQNMRLDVVLADGTRPYGNPLKSYFWYSNLKSNCTEAQVLACVENEINEDSHYNRNIEDYV